MKVCDYSIRVVTVSTLIFCYKNLALLPLSYSRESWTRLKHCQNNSYKSLLWNKVNEFFNTIQSDFVTFIYNVYKINKM